MKTETEKQQIAEAFCALIKAALPSADQTTKWNAPNFVIHNRDLVTLNLSSKHAVRIVFHRGAQALDTKTGNRLVADDSGRLTWATDQRAYASFPNLAAVNISESWLGAFCQKWVDAAK